MENQELREKINKILFSYYTSRLDWDSQGHSVREGRTELQAIYIDQILSLLPPTPSCEVEPKMETCGISTKDDSRTYGCPHCGRPIRTESTPSSLGEEEIKTILWQILQTKGISKVSRENDDTSWTYWINDFAKALAQKIPKPEETGGSHHSTCNCLECKPQEKFPKQFPISACCNASVKIDGDKKEGTMYYVCEACNKPCDLAEWNKPQINIGLRTPDITEQKQTFTEDDFIPQKEYCSCSRDYKPGYKIEVDKVNPPTCAKCHKEIKPEVINYNNKE